MAVHFHPLTVKKLFKETADCVTITFDIPAALKDLFTYEHGQNITLKKNIDGEEVRRSYSICSAPFENDLSIAVKKIAKGKFSTYANDHLQKGDVLDVLPPTGRFNTLLNKTSKKNYLAFAAGSGITPIISIIKTTLATEPAASFTMVYGNRSRNSIIFFEELAGLKNRYIDRFNFINILSREKTETALNFGRIDSAKLTALQKLIDYKSMDEAFICGPGEMIFTVREFLEKQGVDQKKIHFELFTSPDNRAGGGEQSPLAENTGPNSRITIQLDGRSFDFDLAFNSESVLDAALKQGADLPYACKGGVCCTCRARLIEGQVKMDANYALEAEELAKGFILTCQSHPLTGKVVIDFDSR
ncbi:MAG: phenylacetate-CoA oxygenase/reductase subunit PaaK [Ferruginibacter sp.]|nr:phenylacetate-CoA oxygenase/reductase subunit PaaK [Ferruginibacter sp.]